ncbi:MAG TPA: hypothetical protein VIF40_12990 [Methylosinus sp.]|jgi:hypothetical protein|uniref:hypothetical protein n=1 Tax=Methylosinus sp. TaxID=427 RepID=UPI002F92DB32
MTTTTTSAATSANVAALDFRPWEHRADEWTPPSNAEWASLANPYLITIRLAWLTLFKTKPEVMKIVESMNDDDGRQMMEGFVDTIDFFKSTLAILQNAEARILCAGAAVIVRDEDAAEASS